MNDEQFFLANAYLDGELTAEERRIAEADPDVMSEVEQLSALQDAVRTVEPPSADARESAIAAAMAEFGGAGASSAAEPAMWAPIPLRARPASARFLGVAAAIVAVGAIGIVLARAGSGGDDDTAAIEPAATAEMSVADSDVAMIESAPAADADEAADGGGADGVATNDDAEEQADDLPTDSGTASEDVSGEASPVARIAVPPDFDPDATITDERQLGIYGAYLLQQRDRGELGATPEHNCPGPSYAILDEAVAAFGDDGNDTTVYIGVGEADGFVYAIDVDTCEPIAVGSLSEP